MSRAAGPTAAVPLLASVQLQGNETIVHGAIAPAPTSLAPIEVYEPSIAPTGGYESGEGELEGEIEGEIEAEIDTPPLPLPLNSPSGVAHPTLQPPQRDRADPRTMPLRASPKRRRL